MREQQIYRRLVREHRDAGYALFPGTAAHYRREAQRQATPSRWRRWRYWRKRRKAGW